MNQLSDIQVDSVFEVNWGGSDNDSGIRFYNIYVSVNEQPYRVWKYLTSNTNASFIGNPDSTYKFFSEAFDYVGNKEDIKNDFEAQTKVEIPTISAINNYKFEQSIKIYPNPNQGSFNIEFNNKTLKVTKIEVIDITGRNIDHFKLVKTNQYLIEMNGYEPGIYFIKFVAGENIYTKKIIIN